MAIPCAFPTWQNRAGARRSALRLPIDGQPLDVGDASFSQDDIRTIPATWLVPSRLAPGEHRLEARELENDAVHSTSIVCEAGQLLYLDVRIETAIAEVVGALGIRKHRVKSLGLRFEPSKTAPDEFQNRPLMQYSAGRWLGRIMHRAATPGVSRETASP